MKQIIVSNLFKAFSDQQVLSSINLNISQKSRIALCGINGSGKTTLLKTIVGETEADSGTVNFFPQNVVVGYLPQSGFVFESRQALKDFALQAFADLAQKEQLMFTAGQQLEQLKNQKNERKKTVDLEQARLETVVGAIDQELTLRNFYYRDNLIEKIYTGLGFNLSDINRQIEEFSGGMQMRIALAKILLQQPDFLLLDEPTNYLDIEQREWLKKYLNQYAGGIIIISHDIHFIDSLANQIVELDRGKVTLYQGNYSRYKLQKEQALIQLEKQIRKQQLRVAHLEKFINRFRSKASKAAQVQSRIKELEKIELLTMPKNNRNVTISLPRSEAPPKNPLRSENLAKSYGTKTVFSDINFSTQQYDRLLICGENGAGKSTLMRIIAGLEAADIGTVTFSTGIKAGYFAQDYIKSFDMEATVFAEVSRDAANIGESYIRSLLGAFLFSNDAVYKPVKVLSGGEQSRLALCKLLLSPINLLLLDEPTNHLDIDTQHILLKFLNQFNGAIIIVCHDRYFNEQLATSVLEIAGGCGRYFNGGYSYYLEQRELTFDHAGKINVSPTPPDKVDTADYRQNKQKRNLLRKLNLQEQTALSKIKECEQSLRHNQAMLERPEIHSDYQKAAKIQSEILNLENIKNELEAEWENLAEKLQKIN